MQVLEVEEHAVAMIRTIHPGGLAIVAVERCHIALNAVPISSVFDRVGKKFRTHDAAGMNCNDVPAIIADVECVYLGLGEPIGKERLTHILVDGE